MEYSEAKSGLGYWKPPWVFKGSALYQLHLVKAETARAFIPKEFKLVEAFGYTLGGFFLANYEDSPAGMFDELVIIAGIVWNPPTSCAWAARVLVNSDKACVHGRKDVGLPSQVGNFKKRVTLETKTSRFGSFLSKIGMADSQGNIKNHMDIQVQETKNGAAMNICSINLTDAAVMAPPTNDLKERWMGLGMKISLPSFSGRTEYNPHLLKYTCQIECRVRVVPPAKVQGPAGSNADSESLISTHDSGEDELNRSISIMLSKPVLALKFNCLKMNVEAPSVVSE